MDPGERSRKRAAILGGLPLAFDSRLHYTPMSRLPLALYRAAEVRELDRRAIEVHGISGGELMERAGGAVLEALRARFPRCRRVAVVCGPGNNGGDGYVVARLAKEAGLEPVVLTLGRAPAGGDAAEMRARAVAVAVEMRPFERVGLDSADVVVDALLGTGLQRPVEGEWRETIEAINESRRACRRRVVAIDIPSGLNSDTGAVMGAAVRADVTVSFIGLKAGLYTAEGRDQAGEILFDDLGVPAPVYDGVAPSAQRLDRETLTGLIRPRRRNAHKGTFGHVLVVGGGRGMPGAAHMCGEAALRAGAGLVTLAVHPLNAAVVNAGRPEMLAFGVRGARELKPLLERASVVALGPGLSKDAWSRALWRAVVGAGVPLVVDADALNLLALAPSRQDGWILTPHPGEAGRLLQRSTRDIQNDRLAAASELVERFGGVSVLKGAGTLIAAADELWLCDRGNPGMASGGTGDVLTGVLAALRAQGLGPLDAARLGVWLHATAGDDAATAGEAGLIASDLHAHIRRRLNQLAHENPQS